MVQPPHSHRRVNDFNDIVYGITLLQMTPLNKHQITGTQLWLLGLRHDGWWLTTVNTIGYDRRVNSIYVIVASDLKLQLAIYRAVLTEIRNLTDQHENCNCQQRRTQ